jgi:molecular chaperone GrpE (heat shock protein)
LLGSLPFVLDYRVTLRLAESAALSNAVARIQNLEAIAGQIGHATGQWQTVQEHANQAARAAGEIGDRMTREAKAFADFMRQANDTEKATLRLENEKLHRAENEWLQTVVRMLDHTFALHAAAVRSGKTAIIQQLTQFQHALREAARRQGLNAVELEPGATFDPQRHQAADAEKPEAGAVIHGLAATGFTFRGQPIRPVLVLLQPPATPAAPAEQPAPPVPAAEQTLL